MKLISEIPHPQMRITVFLWNEKYLIKFEAGPYEQSYKIDATLAENPSDIAKAISDEFVDNVIERFKDMNADFREHVHRNIS